MRLSGLICGHVSDHRPDEEGIKTGDPRFTRSTAKFQTTDLMKKGLRPSAWRASERRAFQTTDLMKKGLRLSHDGRLPDPRRFRPQT